MLYKNGGTLKFMYSLRSIPTISEKKGKESQCLVTAETKALEWFACHYICA